MRLTTVKQHLVAIFLVVAMLILHIGPAAAHPDGQPLVEVARSAEMVLDGQPLVEVAR